MAFREGETIEAALKHVIYYPSRTADKYATIVALHGRGTDELDLIPLVLSTGLKEVLIISPRAPRPFDVGVGFAWYDLSGEWTPRPETFRVSLDLLHRFMNEIESGYPVDPERIMLLGFSQGAVMSYSVGLLNPKSFLGIAALSGYIPQKSVSFDFDNVKGFSTFVSHGTYDLIIPVQLGRESVELLRKAGAKVDYREYSMGHEVRAETVRDLAAWARTQLQQ